MSPVLGIKQCDCLCYLFATTPVPSCYIFTFVPLYLFFFLWIVAEDILQFIFVSISVIFKKDLRSVIYICLLVSLFSMV
jgi:hypothetical protein